MISGTGSEHQRRCPANANANDESTWSQDFQQLGLHGERHTDQCNAPMGHSEYVLNSPAEDATLCI